MISFLPQIKFIMNLTGIVLLNVSIGVPTTWPWIVQFIVGIGAMLGLFALLSGRRFPRFIEGILPFLIGLVFGFNVSKRWVDAPLFRGLIGIAAGHVALILFFTGSNIVFGLLAFILRPLSTESKIGVWFRYLLSALFVVLMTGMSVFLTQERWIQILCGLSTAVVFFTVGFRLEPLSRTYAQKIRSWLKRFHLSSYVRLVLRSLETGLVLCAFYVGYMAKIGSFQLERPAFVLLFINGFLMTLCWPVFGISFLSAAIGSFLLCVPWGIWEKYWPIVFLTAGGLLWQSIVSWRQRRRSDMATPEPQPVSLRPIWDPPLRLFRLFAGFTFFSLMLIAFLLFLPVLKIPQDDVYQNRFKRLSEQATNLEDQAKDVHQNDQENTIDQDSTGKSKDRKSNKSNHVSKIGIVFLPGDSLYLTNETARIGLLNLFDPLAAHPWQTRLGFFLKGGHWHEPIAKLREVKEEEELKKLERSAEILSNTFIRIAPLIRPGINEKIIEQAIIAEILSQGAEGLSFPPIVGSGYNATLPHYMDNDQEMKEHLVVIDIGANDQNYASDMTRTFPVSGQFSEREKEIYNIVKEAQEASINICKAGVTFRELHQAAAKVIEAARYQKAFLHFVGHHVGLEVHDPHAEKMEVNMVITIEPGIYLPEESIGVRIEDSFVVKEKECRSITLFPTAPEAIESAMRILPK